MKLLLLACLVGVAVGEAFEPITTYYHEAVGIEEAARIKAAEEASDFDGSRIVGGTPSGLGVHPHLGGLVITLTTGATSVCGSSLISNNRALTAAHCWWDGRNQARQFVVVLGSTTIFSGGTRLTTTNVQIHANFNPNNLNNDIAIIVIPHVNYNNNIRNIQRATGTNNFAGSWATAAGFGRTADNAGIPNNQVQRHVNLQVITNAVCQSTYGSSVVIASVLCTSSANGSTNVCGGDSGGPLAVGSGTSRTLIGVTNFVAAAGCQSSLPAGFARVTSFNTWINQRL